jgi:hypothetical protein
MSLKRTLIVKLPRALGAAAVGLGFLGLGGVVMCTSYPTFKNVPVDCSELEGYTLYDKATDTVKDRDLTLDNFGGWFSATDTAAGVAGVSAVDPIPDGPVCQNTKAGKLTATRNNDWGCIFGSYEFGAGREGEDASDWEGIAFFARAPGNTTKAFTVSLTDDNSESNVPGRPDPDAGTARCTNYITDAGVGAAGPATGATGIDPQTGTPLSGSGTTRAPYVDECGNSYTTTVTVTSDWQFYTIPFGDFQQASNPNRVPNTVFQAGTVPGTGLLTSGLRHLVFRAGKEAQVELWLAKLAFYKKKAQ